MKLVAALVVVLFVAGQICAQGMPLPADCVKALEDRISLFRNAATLAKQWDIIGLYATTVTGDYLTNMIADKCKDKSSEVDVYLKLKYKPDEIRCIKEIDLGMSSVTGKVLTRDIQGANMRLDDVKKYFAAAFNCAPFIGWTGSKGKI